MGIVRVKKNGNKSESGLWTDPPFLRVHKLSRPPPHCQQLIANTGTLGQHHHHPRFCTLIDSQVYFAEINLITHLLPLNTCCFIPKVYQPVRALQASYSVNTR